MSRKQSQSTVNTVKGLLLKSQVLFLAVLVLVLMPLYAIAASSEYQLQQGTKRTIEMPGLSLEADKNIVYPGEEISFTTSITLPDDLSGVDTIEVIQAYIPQHLSYVELSAELSIDGLLLVEGLQYTLTDSASGGSSGGSPGGTDLLTATLTDSMYPFASLEGAEFVLQLSFILTPGWVQSGYGEGTSIVAWMELDGISSKTTTEYVWVIRPRVVQFVDGETEYTADMRPNITRMIKYVYTDPSFDDAFLIAAWPAQPGLTNQAVVVLPGQTVDLWVKYVEDFFASPTIYYYHLMVIGIPHVELAYMTSLAGQNTHPPDGGIGTKDDPFTASIQVPLSKDRMISLNREPIPGVDDIMMGIPGGRGWFFPDSSFGSNFSVSADLSEGINNVYIGINTSAAAHTLYYNIEVIRGFSFSKQASSDNYMPGKNLDYTINLTLPKGMDTYSQVEIVDEYPADKMSFVDGSARLSLDGLPLTAGIDFVVNNTVLADVGTLTVELLADLSALDGSQVELMLTFAVARDAEGTIENQACALFDGAVGGIDTAVVDGPEPLDITYRIISLAPSSSYKTEWSFTTRTDGRALEPNAANPSGLGGYPQHYAAPLWYDAANYDEATGTFAAASVPWDFEGPAYDGLILIAFDNVAYHEDSLQRSFYHGSALGPHSASAPFEHILVANSFSVSKALRFTVTGRTLTCLSLVNGGVSEAVITYVSPGTPGAHFSIEADDVTLMFESVALSGSAAAGILGGGIDVGTPAQGATNVSIYNPVIRGCLNNDRGALDIKADSLATVYDGVIAGNSSQGSGAGIYVHEDGTLIMENGTVTHNTAEENGGGAFNAGALTLEGGTISNNAANKDGGGVFNAGTLALKSGTVSNNEAVGGGGGIFTTSYQNLTVAADSTFSNNSASAAFPDRNPAIAAVYAANIKCTVWTSPFSQGYNNFDINNTYVKTFGTVNVICLDMDTEEVLKSTSYPVLEGDYGPYHAESIRFFLPGVLSPASAPISGTLMGGEVVDIIYLYKRGMGTVTLIHYNLWGEVEITRSFFYAWAGDYGPYPAERFTGFGLGELMPGSDLPSGELDIGQNVTIVYGYHKELVTINVVHVDMYGFEFYREVNYVPVGDYGPYYPLEGSFVTPGEWDPNSDPVEGKTTDSSTVLTIRFIYTF